MGIIVAIGGGELRNFETLEIDEYIVKSTGKENPKALFIPTASGDALAYVDTFNKVYGEKLGCKTDSLLLSSENLEDKEIENKILSSDLIYVGGGNTEKMIKLWKEK
jgi:dipeptidase E